MATDVFGTGVSVKLVLPGAFDTEIWDEPDNDTAPYSGPLAPPEEGAVGIVESITSDRFEHYVPDMKAVVEMKTKDIDVFMAGMRAMVDGGDRGNAVDGGDRGNAVDGGDRGNAVDGGDGEQTGDPA